MAGIQESMELGVIIERRSIDHPWARHAWRAVEVLADADALANRHPQASSADSTRFLAATLPLRLYRKETEGYRVNLSQDHPSVYVVMRGAPTDPQPVPFLVTGCPYEAGHYDISAEEWVDAVPMPAAVAALVVGFIDAHHVDQPFVKRTRQPHDPRKGPSRAAARKGPAIGSRYG